MNKKLTNNLIKSIFLVLMLVIVALSFCGCAQVRVMTITNEDNTIDEMVTITIVPETLNEAGYSPQQIIELKNDIMIKSQAQAQVMKDDLNEKIFKDLLLTFDNETREVLNSFKDGISVVKSDWRDNTYAIGIRFKNIDVYKYYYDIKENAKTEMQEEEHFFYNKVYYYASTMYVKHQDLYNKVNAYYSSQYPGLINSESNELLYTYKTDLRRQHSDADYITYESGEYYHTWIVDPNNLDEPIMLYYNIANPENWIIVSLLITLGVTILLAVGIFGFKLIKKDNKKEEQEM